MCRLTNVAVAPQLLTCACGCLCGCVCACVAVCVCVVVLVTWQPADPKKEKRMSAEDCAKYIVAAIVDGLDEVWLSPQPILAFLYIYQCVHGGMGCPTALC